MRTWVNEINCQNSYRRFTMGQPRTWIKLFHTNWRPESDMVEISVELLALIG